MPWLWCRPDIPATWEPEAGETQVQVLSEEMV